MAETNKKITDRERETELLKSILTKTKITKKNHRIASLEKERHNLIKKTNSQFPNYAKDWCTENNLISIHQDTKKIIEMAALIPPSTAEVERYSH